jgi:pimeloyl-ACP methyl ester carboxylesterase
MPEFDSDGVRLRYMALGPDSARPIVLVHGFCSDYELNWVGSRWQETLLGAGWRVLGLDCRGHGHSEKPHDPAAYRLRIMAADVVRLLDHLDADFADYLGYSMGARIGLEVAARHGERVGRAVLGGLGPIQGAGKAEAIARRMRGDDSVHDPVAETFYTFAAARPINDLEALACCILGMQEDQPPDLASIEVPLALMAGDKDPIARGAPELAEQIPGAGYVPIEGRDHMNAVPARQFKSAALDFLSNGTGAPLRTGSG